MKTDYHFHSFKLLHMNFWYSKNSNIPSFSNSKKAWILIILVISCCPKLNKHIDDNKRDNKNILRSKSGDLEHVKSSQHPARGHVIVIMVLIYT